MGVREQWHPVRGGFVFLVIHGASGWSRTTRAVRRRVYNPLPLPTGLPMLLYEFSPASTFWSDAERKWSAKPGQETRAKPSRGASYFFAQEYVALAESGCLGRYIQQTPLPPDTWPEAKWGKTCVREESKKNLWLIVLYHIVSYGATPLCDIIGDNKRRSQQSSVQDKNELPALD